MAVSQRINEGAGNFYQFGFGNFHELPAVPAAERPIFIVRVVGLQGEGHIVDSRKGREISLVAVYRGRFTLSDLSNDFTADESVTLLGELIIANQSYGNCTYLGANMIAQPRIDGKNGLWFVPVVLRWRMRT